MCAAPTERITYTELHSAALGRSLPVAVIKPASNGRAEQPVLYFLHGRGRHHRSLIESAALPAMLEAPFYIVLPQGEDGWYIDSPADPAARYAAYLQEVMAWAEKTLPISRAPRRRGIAGWSMGGYGAVRFAESRPGEFGFVASIIGLLDFPRPENLPEGQNYRVPTARFTNDAEVWASFNPVNAVHRLSGTALTLVLATNGFERTMNENFLAALSARRLVARVHWLEGGHQFPLVEKAVPLVIADAAEYFGSGRLR
jgi:S-formylglutathione hydrolase FrmB